MNKHITHLVSLIAALAVPACTTATVDDVSEPEAPAAPVTEEATAQIEPATIQAAMRSNFMSTARGCYERLLEDEPTAAGRVVMRFVIDGGSAHQVEVDLTEGDLSGAPFVGCMEAGMAQVAFPVADGEVAVAYPVVLTPD